MPAPQPEARSGNRPENWPENRLSAVVLGGGAPDELARAAGVSAKALVPFAGRPLVHYVLDALHGCGAVGRIVYVGEADAYVTAHTAQRLPAGSSFVDSFAAGLEAALAATPEQRVLVTTADLPWLRSEALTDFVASASGADLTYPIVAKETAEAQFPAQRRTFVRLADGRFTGGNMMLLSPAAVPVLLPFIERAYQGRKNPLALARLFGVDFILRLFLGRLSLQQIEDRAERVLGVSVRALPTPYASIGADVDKLEHLPVA